MARRVGKCVNYNNGCHYADGDEDIEITGVSPGVPALCPGCGRQLHETGAAGRRQGAKQLWGVLGILGGIVLVGGLIWLLRSGEKTVSRTEPDRSSQTTEHTQQGTTIPDGQPTAPGTGTGAVVPPTPPAPPEPVPDKNMPPCLQAKPEDLRNLLPVVAVDKSSGETIAQALHTYMKFQVNKPVHEAPFYVMRREVQVSEFRKYVQTLDSAQQAQLGNAWSQGKEAHPVASVPWWAAKGYADWLGRETGCPAELPTYNQWVAAALQHAQSEDVILRRDALNPTVEPREPTPATVVDLLGNLREWALDRGGPTACQADGHYTLGEDYQTYPQLVSGEPRCVNQPWPTVGFRLVIRQ